MAGMIKITKHRDGSRSYRITLDERHLLEVALWHYIGYREGQRGAWASRDKYLTMYEEIKTGVIQNEKKGVKNDECKN
jgi:hypothetical protein